MFLSVCAWDKRLLIPLINEAFGMNIPENAKIDHSANEQIYRRADTKEKEKLIKRITDAIIRVKDGVYHFECESKNNGQILIRIAEYDMNISLVDAKYNNHVVDIALPNSAVLFVRNHRDVPNSGIIRYNVNGKAVFERPVEYIMIAAYNLNEIVDKHLFILLPFYLIRYEHALKHNIKNKFELIEKEALEVYNILNEAYEKDNISKKEFEDLITLCNDVLKEISKKSSNKERLGKIMGNEVLLTMEERGVQKGMQQGMQQGLCALINSLKEFCPDFTTLYQKVIANEAYADLTEDEIRKYY